MIVDGELRTQVGMDWLTESYDIELDKLPYYIWSVEEKIDGYIQVRPTNKHMDMFLPTSRNRSSTYTHTHARARTHTHTHTHMDTSFPSLKVAATVTGGGRKTKYGANRAIHFDSVDNETTLAKDQRPRT